MFSSTTIKVPEERTVPVHVAVIMDGNGRWAQKRMLPRIAGHRKGIESVRQLVKRSAELGIEFLTLFAFSTENWRRPPEEVALLMELFGVALQQEVNRLNKNKIKLRIIGDVAGLGKRLSKLAAEAEETTSLNQGLTLTVAVNYGGRWDLLEAINNMFATGSKESACFTENDLTPFLALNYAPEPDLFIRTGGERRISNFLLWQLAYTELYFTDELWPDFDKESFERSLVWFRDRQRRFGRTDDEIQK